MANFASSKNINIMDVSALGQDKEEDDFQLLSAIAENMDTAAFTRLYGKYAKWAFGLFYSRTGSKEAASELSQNLWMYVWDNAGKIIGNHDEKRHTIKGLLYAVIANAYWISTGWWRVAITLCRWTTRKYGAWW